MNNERGNISILLLVMMMLLIGMAGIAIDYGNILIQKQKLSDAVDAAALAGIQDLVRDGQIAKDVALQYANENGVASPEILVDLNNKEITVNGQRNVPFFFGKVFGFNEKNITATSKARLQPISSGTGFAPLGVVKQSFEFGKSYQLKYSSIDSMSGNFGALALGGTGASNYKDNIMFGYGGKLKIGMKVPTETGNMSGPTESGVAYRISLDDANYTCNSHLTATRSCNRVLFIPLIDSLNVNGSSEVTIVGFAAFYVDGVLGNGNESIIEGRFIKTVYPGDWESTSSEGNGLYAVKLVH